MLIKNFGKFHSNSSITFQYIFSWLNLNQIPSDFNAMQIFGLEASSKLAQRSYDSNWYKISLIWCKYISYFSKFCNGSETSCQCQIPFEKPFDHNSDPHSLFIFRPLDFYAPLNISHGWLNPLLSYFIADFTYLCSFFSLIVV